MSENDGKEKREVANAAHELFLLGQKTVEARAVLAELQNQLSDASNRLVDTQQVEQLIEANQQLVLAILLAQSDAATLPHLEDQYLYQELREANAAAKDMSERDLYKHIKDLLQERHVRWGRAI
ncbi:hypothetical protein [Stutzerimonas kunmingensis]|uniref:hypothetical protein n=1 Tax=Stutzerimonas kunmingensis TaxID=1211807 RepID=UPI001E39118D|nr:hypothetical protein [Stutzerimonas kunmingensis]MCB4795452.1 hypothetical protein [Pseudomonas sp. NP21570]